MRARYLLAVMESVPAEQASAAAHVLVLRVAALVAFHSLMTVVGPAGFPPVVEEHALTDALALHLTALAAFPQLIAIARAALAHELARAASAEESFTVRHSRRPDR